MMIGTFTIRGNQRIGYFIEDCDSFNDWGVRNGPDGSNFASREEAEAYAQRCHNFKTGRTMTLQSYPHRGW